MSETFDDNDLRCLAELTVDIFLQCQRQDTPHPDQSSDTDTETTPKLPEPHL